MLRNRFAVAVGCWAFSMLVGMPWGPAFLNPAAAQEEEPAKTTRMPLVIVNVASIERLLSDVDFMFESAKRPELSDVVASLLANVGDLKGLDRDKPFGFMLFLAPGLLPRPVPVGYVPVTNIDEWMQAQFLGRFTPEKVEGKDSRYKLTRGQPMAGGRRRRPGIEARSQGGYVFLSNDQDSLDGELPDPISLTKQLSSRYDVAVSVNLKNVPEAMKTIFLDFLRASFETELQQRDNESDGAYRLRKENGMSTLELIELLLTQGEDLTLGWNVSSKSKNAVIELNVKAAADSKFARYLKDIGGKRSYFSSLLDRKVPLTISSSWMLDKRGKKVAAELLNLVEGRLSTQLSAEKTDEKETKIPNSTEPVRRLFKALSATAENGHLDLFVQFVGESPGKLVLIGGMKVAQGAAMSTAVTDILRRLKDHPNLAELKLNAATHQGIVFHRMEGKQARPRDNRLFGEKPGLYFGAGPKAIWFAAGGDKALPELKRAMDVLADDPSTAAVGRDPDAPFQLVAHMSNWLGWAENPGPVQQLAKEAFSEGGDTLRIDFRPTETGARLRIELDEGFIRLIGMSIARRFDRNQ